MMLYGCQRSEKPNEVREDNNERHNDIIDSCEYAWTPQMNVRFCSRPRNTNKGQLDMSIFTNIKTILTTQTREIESDLRVLASKGVVFNPKHIIGKDHSTPNVNSRSGFMRTMSGSPRSHIK